MSKINLKENRKNEILNLNWKNNSVKKFKNTDFIYNLYNTKEFNIKTFDKKYLVSFQNRNDKDVEHLLITNY